MFRSIVRNSFKLIGWVLITCGVIVLNIWAVVEHYLSAKGALELLGFEQAEIWRDKLIGQLFGAFVPGATLPMAVALTIAAGESIALFIIFNELFRVIELVTYRRELKLQAKEMEGLEREEASRRESLEDRLDKATVPKIVEDYDAQIKESEFRESGYIDARKNYEAEVRGASAKIIETTLAIGMFALLLTYAIKYEMELFRYRSLAGISFNINDQRSEVEQAVEIPTWENLAPLKGGFFAYQLAHAGAWGYLAFTALCCLALEKSVRKVGRRFELLCNSFAQDSQTADADKDIASPSDDSGQSDLGDYDDPPGNPGDGFYTNPNDQEPVPPNPYGRPTVATEPRPTPSDGADDPGGPANMNEYPPFQHRPQSTSQHRPDNADLCEVVGQSGVRVSRNEALENPQLYHVDPITGEVWDRMLWGSIHPADDPEPPKAKGAFS